MTEQNEKVTPFWMVLREGGSHPVVKHDSLEDAHTEAMRLAKDVPGSDFFVLKCIHALRGHVHVEHRVLDDG